MIDWFLALALSEQIFAGLAIGFGSLLVVIMLLSLVGAETDADVDVDGGAFTVKGILAFLTFFGLGGWIMLRSGAPIWAAGLVGFGTGYAMMSTLALLLTRLRRFDTDGGRQEADLLGQEGEVYLTIPGSGQGSGRIQVQQGTRYVEIEAVTKGPRIPSKSKVRITKVLGPASVVVEAIVRVGERKRSNGFIE